MPLLFLILGGAVFGGAIFLKSKKKNMPTIDKSDWYPRAFQKVLLDEGIVTEQVRGDKGGRTTLGIASGVRYAPDGHTVLGYGPIGAIWPKEEAEAYRLLVTNKDRAGAIAFAKAFYKKNFWDYMRVEELPTFEIASAAFNMGVNHGSNLIRNEVNLLANDTDGFTNHDAETFTRWIAGLYIKDAKQPDQVRFYNGWMDRLNRLRQELGFDLLSYVPNNPWAGIA